jgi:thiosulfate reductase cytochrome b subunit
MSSNHTKIYISSEHTAPLIGIVIGFVLTVFMLMWIIITMNAVSDSMRSEFAIITDSLRRDLRRSDTELRLLQMHQQDYNAILIRQGIMRPGDLTTGPTNQDKVKK